MNVKLLRGVVVLAALFMPWPLRRVFLNKLLGYKIDKTARIGFSWLCPIELEMGSNSYIGHLNYCRGLALLRLEDSARIGNLNWISGHPINSKEHYDGQTKRFPCLRLDAHSAVTNRHLVDCTDTVTIGAFATLGGWRSQVLTHAIDFQVNLQVAAPVQVGAYCFVGTSCVLLPGSALPPYSILGASSLLMSSESEEYTLYAGVPAKPIKHLPTSLAYFSRTAGHVR